MIDILLGLVCALGMCHVEHIVITPEAAAVATCESGDTVTLGSLEWDAININVDGTVDGGAWQINDYWIWSSTDRWMMRPIAQRLGMTSDDVLTAWPRIEDAPPAVQYAAFEVIWNDGYGWQHWSASKPCWEQWLDIDETGRATWRY